MNCKVTNTTNQPIDTNLKILKVGQKILIDEFTKFHKELNNIPKEEINVDELKEKYNNIATYLPKFFTNLIEDPTAPLDMIINMIITAYAIGNKQVDGKKASMGIAYELHRRYTDKS